MNNKTVTAWLAAMRLRTVPLAFSSIGMAGFLAAAKGEFRPILFLFCLLTTLFLQILSNLANDYGDTLHGADSPQRTGPQRQVQTGTITPQAMRRAMLICATFAMLSGATLIWLAFGGLQLLLSLLFLVLGGGAIWSAINYTAGHNPYGYIGLGDLFVFLFFGLVGVIGTYYLQTNTIPFPIWLPAISCGCFATAVLNLNNVRDITSDRQAGKHSLPVRYGRKFGIAYHKLLLVMGLLSALIYVLWQWQSAWQFLFLLTTPLFVRNTQQLAHLPDHELDPLLKQLVLSTLLFVLTFGLGQLLG